MVIFLKYSLNQKISVSFSLVIVICIVMLTVLSNLLFENKFTDYIKNEQKNKNINIVNSIKTVYEKYGSFDKNSIENIGIEALENGVIIKVEDEFSNTLWDATEHNGGLCSQMIDDMAKNMNNKYPNLNGGYIEDTYQVTFDSNIVGNVNIGYYGPFYLNDDDFKFIYSINKVIFLVGAISLVISLIVSSIISRRISKPIAKVIEKTKHISIGYFGDRIDEKSNTKEISELISSVNDLTNELEKKENLKKKITSDVAHELRTPLCSIQGNLQAMMDGVLDVSKQRLQSCYEEILRITNLVSDLEKLTEYENENLKLNKIEFNLSEAILNVLNNFENDFESKNIKVNYSNENISIIADKDKIIQVIVNILSNAIKYNKQNGNIDISINKEDIYTEIIFKDNGIGISKEDLPYVFERLYRADKSRNRYTGGSGIGLAICKVIIEAHNGKISIDSKIEEGTEVIILIPNK